MRGILRAIREWRRLDRYFNLGLIDQLTKVEFRKKIIKELFR